MVLMSCHLLLSSKITATIRCLVLGSVAIKTNEYPAMGVNPVFEPIRFGIVSSKASVCKIVCTIFPSTEVTVVLLGMRAIFQIVS